MSLSDCIKITIFGIHTNDFYDMGKVLVIGAGGVGSVVISKMASLPEVFTEVLLASRTKSKCDAIAARTGSDRIKTAAVDADNVPELRLSLIHI